jgi:hypothetical protein
VLDDYERAALRDIQRRLSDDDPDFARSFGAGAQRLERAAPPLLPREAYTIMTVFGAAFAVISLLAGSPFVALLFAGLSGWTWYARPRGAEKGP